MNNTGFYKVLDFMKDKEKYMHNYNGSDLLGGKSYLSPPFIEILDKKVHVCYFSLENHIDDKRAYIRFKHKHSMPISGKGDVQTEVYSVQRMRVRVEDSQ